VYESFFRSSSGFFEAALSNDWTEAHDRIVELPECTLPNFQIYHQWLLSKRLHTRFGSQQQPEVARQLEWNALIDAYLLGDYLQDINYKDTLQKLDRDLQENNRGFAASPASCRHDRCSQGCYVLEQ
jgi:hypothetical protein